MIYTPKREIKLYFVQGVLDMEVYLYSTYIGMPVYMLVLWRFVMVVCITAWQCTCWYLVCKYRTFWFSSVDIDMNVLISQAKRFYKSMHTGMMVYIYIMSFWKCQSRTFVISAGQNCNRRFLGYFSNQQYIPYHLKKVPIPEICTLFLSPEL